MTDAAPEPTPEPEPEPAGAGPFGDEEAKPATRQRGRLRRVIDRAADSAGDEPGNGSDAKPARQRRTRERAPKTTTGKRERGDWLFSLLYGGLGTAAQRSGRAELIPTARILQWNAPVAGHAFDDLFAGTKLDRWVVQPLSQRREKVETAANVAGLPVLVYLMSVRPESAAVLEGMAMEMFAANISAMAPVIKDRQKRERETAKVIAELAESGMVERHDDGSLPTLAELWGSVWTLPPGMDEPAPPEPDAPDAEPEP